VIQDACLKLERAFEPSLRVQVQGAMRALEQRGPGRAPAAQGEAPPLLRMHRAKRALLSFIKRAEAMHDCLEELLQDDGDLVEMHLSDKYHFWANQRVLLRHGSPVSTFAEWRAGQTEQAEMMMEVYSETIEYLLVEARNLEEAVKDTEELVSLQLDTQRNQLLGVELLIMVISGFFALGAFVVGIFGSECSSPSGVA
jgi:magnesium transporter